MRSPATERHLIRSLAHLRGACALLDDASSCHGPEIESRDPRTPLMTLNDAILAVENVIREVAGESVLVVLSLHPASTPVPLPPSDIRQCLLTIARVAKESMVGGGSLTIATAPIAQHRLEIHDHVESMPEQVLLTIKAEMTNEPGSSSFSSSFGVASGLDTDHLRDAVQAAGGRLQILRHPAGTALQIVLPSAESRRPSAPQSPTPHSSDGGNTVLVLGDDPDGRAFLREALSCCGYRVLEAANREHADVIVSHLHHGIHLIIDYSPSADPSKRAEPREGYPPVPVLLLPASLLPGSVDSNESAAEIARRAEEVESRVRLALEASRPDKSILIVDDDAAVRRTIAELLEAAGYRVSQAANGKQALSFLAKETPDLMLTEIVMPEKEGLQLIQDMRTLHPDVAIIAMSGTTRADNYLSIARVLGAKRTIKKPLSPNLLLKTLREALDTRS